MCYYQTPDGKQTYTGMAGVTASMMAKNGIAYPFGGEPPKNPPSAPLYPNGPAQQQAPLPTIGQSPAKGAPSLVSSDPGLTIEPSKTRQLGAVSEGAGLNVPR